MIHLRDFVNIKEENNKYNYPSNFGYTFDDFMKSNGVNEDTVTEDMMDWYTIHVCDKRTFSHPAVFSNKCMQIDEYVTEMLQTTSIKLLLKELNKSLGGAKEKHVSIYKYDDVETKANKDVYRLLIPQELYNKDKITQTCEKMMWQWTSVKVSYDTLKNPYNKNAKALFIEYKDLDGKYAYITVEPLQSEKRTTYVQNYCDGIVYHLCSKDDVDSIMKSGLRMKGEDNNYRFSKNRVYFICSPEENDLVETIKTVAISKDFWDYDTDSLSKDAALLKIDVSDYNIDFYMDKMYDSETRDFVVYAFGYFPPKMIEELNLEDLYDE